MQGTLEWEHIWSNGKTGELRVLMAQGPDGLEILQIWGVNEDDTVYQLNDTAYADVEGSLLQNIQSGRLLPCDIDWYDEVDLDGVYNQWTTICPKCRQQGGLRVTSAVLSATGKTVYPDTRLKPDGFIVDPTDEYDYLKDQSTEDEEVTCSFCNSKSNLRDLTL
jgi:hypothetical protein